MYKSLLLIGFLLFGPLFCVAGQTPDKSHPQSKQDPISTDQVILNSSSDISRTAQDFYKEGLRLTDEGLLSQAVEELQQAVKIDPEYAEAHAALGRAYFKLRQWQNAVDSLHRASALKSKHSVSQESRQAKDKQDSRNPETEAKALKPLQQSTRPRFAPLARSEPGKDESAGPGTSTVAIQTKPSAQTNTNFVATKPVTPKPEPTPEEEKRPSIAVPSPSPTQQTVSEHANGAVTQTSAAITNQQIETKAPLDPATSAAQGPPAEPRTSEPSMALTLPPTPTEPAPQTNKDASATVSSTETSVTGPKPVKTESETTAPSEPSTNSTRSSTAADEIAVDSPRAPSDVKVAMSVTPTSTPLETKTVAPIPTGISSAELSLTKIYRIGPGDVLDVQINDSDPTRSTLFTVNAAGFLEHPMLAEPLHVTGFTPEEISAKVEAALTTNSSGEKSKVMVGVRDYASHSILVSGLAKDSGTKFLRREAIPLYVVVADAQPLPQAARVTVVRNEVGQMFDIDLTQAGEMNMMVHPGDVITLQPNVTQFYYIGGEVKSPGEKTFRRGLTLTQAIITAGGATGKSKFAQIARDDGQGFLVDTKVDLNEIQFGKTIDPSLKPGDRITILH